MAIFQWETGFGTSKRDDGTIRTNYFGDTSFSRQASDNATFTEKVTSATRILIRNFYWSLCALNAPKDDTAYDDIRSVHPPSYTMRDTTVIPVANEAMYAMFIYTWDALGSLIQRQKSIEEEYLVELT